MRPRAASAGLAALALCLALFAPGARAGAQKQEPLSAAIRATLAKAVNSADTASRDNPQTQAWIRAHLPKVAARMKDEAAAHELLSLVRYEALRAGLDPQLILAIIDTESAFRKYAVSTAGARGYMQVMPFWVQEIGMPGQSLFHPRTNLRYGCVILRHYLRLEDGNLFNALGRYNGSLGRPEYPDRVLRLLHERWTAPL